MRLDMCYSQAKKEIISRGFASEIEWQEQQVPEIISESFFLQEAAWVVYCSGFREATVRRCFDFISLCFCDWCSASEIVKNKNKCVSTAMYVFNNKRKHDAVAKIAQKIANCGFNEYKHQLLCQPIQVLQELPFIGKITSYHLAKNLGFEVAKPDRHLVRLKDFFGFSSVTKLCQHLSEISGDPVRVVDIVLWRYMEQNGLRNLTWH